MGNGLEINNHYCKKGHLKIGWKPTNRGCLICKKINLDIWRKKNPDLFRRQWIRNNHSIAGRNNDLKRLFGITLDEFNQMFLMQSGKCKLCGIHQSNLTIALSVDHDHQTKKVRGLLCRKCNSMIGFANDNPIILEMAAKYLKEHNG